GLKQDTLGEIEAILYVETRTMLRVDDPGAECLGWTRRGWVSSSRESIVNTCGEGALVLFLKHLRRDVVMDILRNHNQAVWSSQNGRVITQLQGASGGGRMGEGAGIVGNEVDVELLGIEQPSKAIETEGKTGSQLLAQIECPEVRARAEEL